VGRRENGPEKVATESDIFHSNNPTFSHDTACTTPSLFSYNHKGDYRIFELFNCSKRGEHSDFSLQTMFREFQRLKLLKVTWLLEIWFLHDRFALLTAESSSRGHALLRSPIQCYTQKNGMEMLTNVKICHQESDFSKRELSLDSSVESATREPTRR
jgi:hypothetical protein